MTGEVVLELDRVTKRFGRVTAVDDVSERFVRGEYCCILGPSGCGKTTLLRLIAGFEQPDAGAIRMHGADVARVPPEKRDVNVVFQSYALFPHLSVRENVAVGLRMRKLARAESADRVRDALALVHLTAEAERLPRQLSGGQQQRVALARALVNRPSVLLLDEPLSALDMTLRRRMQDELRRIQRETGVTFLHITHDQAEALSLADRVAVMRGGRVVQIGSPRDVYLRPASPFVASFVGSTNLIDAHIDEAGIAVVSPAVRLGPLQSPRQRDVVLAIRPEVITLTVADETAPLRGVVRQVAFTGADIECEVVLADGVVLRARVPGDAAAQLAPGAAVGVLVRPEDIVVLPREAEPS
jgi:spermidine/putrescine transport system ATP-binding protein